MVGKPAKVEAGSGGVFVDRGFADAGERRLRAQLAMRINELIAERKLTQAKAAAVFGVPQPHVSERGATWTTCVCASSLSIELKGPSDGKPLPAPPT